VKPLCAFLLAAAAALAQSGGPPQVVNAKVETRAFSGDLSSEMKSAAPAWFGYSIKVKRGDHDTCHTRAAQPVPLEGTDTIALLFRVENNQVQKVRIFSLECSLDAGGLPFTWIAGVPAAQSIDLLRRLIHQNANVSNEAILSLSMHDDPAATDALIQLAKADPSPHIRQQALFWLSQKAGSRAIATITDAILNDPDTNVKKRAVFALAQLPKDEGVPKLIEIARTQRNPEVRKQAFFWLGQSRDPRALAFFEEVLVK